jgi:glycosyltransferase involved in cell wall biosynthesis
VISVLNAADTLPQQLEALASQGYKGAWEVIIADNGSTDGSERIARRWAGRLPGLQVLSASDRRGITHARNAGVAASHGDFLAFCDADDEVVPGWLEAMAEAAQHCDMVGGRIDEESLNDDLTKSWRPPWVPHDQLPVALDFLPCAVSASCGIWADVFQAVGGWNEDYAQGGTDVELSWRVQLSSYRLCFAPHAVVRYRFRRSLPMLVHQFYRYGRAEPQLYNAFHRYGMRRSFWRACLAWGWILLHVGDLAGGRAKRGFWLRTLAYRWGRVCGSVRKRVLFP